MANYTKLKVIWKNNLNNIYKDLFDVYNAFTKQITNSLDKGKDIINTAEKTLLLRQILEF